MDTYPYGNPVHSARYKDRQKNMTGKRTVASQKRLSGFSWHEKPESRFLYIVNKNQTYRNLHQLYIYTKRNCKTAKNRLGFLISPCSRPAGTRLSASGTPYYCNGYPIALRLDTRCIPFSV